MRTLDIGRLDRSVVRHDPDKLDRLLATAWKLKDRMLVLEFSIPNVRMLNAARQRWDKQGWSLCARTQLQSKTIAVFVKVRYRGARGSYAGLTLVKGGKRGA